MKLGAVLAGVFVGAVLMEVVHRVHPNLMKDIGEKTRQSIEDIGRKTKKSIEVIGDAFKDGYRGESAAD